MKRVTAVLLIVTLVMSMAGPCTAAVQPRYTYIASAGAELEIDQTWGIASFQGWVTAKDEYPVKVVVTLQVYKNESWQTVKTWQDEGVFGLYVESQYAVYRGYPYRINVLCYVYDDAGNTLETLSVFDYANYY